MIVQDHPEKSPGAKAKRAHCPPYRTQARFLRRGWFWAACLGFVLLAGNMLSNVPVAHASSLTHHNGVLASTQPPQVSGPRVSPNLNPQPLSVGAWHAQQAAPASVSTTDSAPFAANPHGRKPGEQPDLRTATSDTYLNANGTWTLKSYGSPINYKDGNGHWQPIDSSLVGDTSITGYAYGNKADDWHVHFARQAGGPNLVHVKLPNGTMQETLLPNGTMQETLQGAASVKGQASGSQMEYANVFPGTDLLYNVSSSNLEELLLLQDAQGPSSYTFVYHLPGASAHQDADGNVIFTDAKGTILLTVGGVFMYESDAHGQMSPQGLGSQSIQISLASQGADFLVTLTPDQTWLKDPKRHFPVSIDPSQTWSGTNSGGNTTNGNVYASANNESAYPDNGYGNDQLGMRIGNCDATQGTGVSRAYLKFPVGSAPAGVRVTSADLAVYQTSMYGGGLGVAVNVEVMPVAWNATTLTWNNRPTGGITVGSANTASTQLTWVHWNVSAAAAQWWQGGMALNGLSLRYANESQQCQFFESDNASSNRPVLTINYVQDTTTPTGKVTFAGGTHALMYSGMDNSATSSYAYMKVFDLSSQKIVVGPNTTLSYWIFPQDHASSSDVPSGDTNSTCVAVDLVFTDGSVLRNMGAVDQHGNKLHPAQQCGHLSLDQWNQVVTNIGAVANGKTISKLDVGYDQPANTGAYRGYIDTLAIGNPGNTPPLFATGFEGGNPQPTWGNTVDTGPQQSAGNISNVGGICCGLTGPEMGVRQELSHSGDTITSTKTLNVAVQPSSLDPGSIAEWNSNWTSVNGISSNNGAHGEIPAHTSVNSGGTELDANTSSCGSTACWVQTYFTHTINGNNWPTFTAQFKTSNTNNFEVGIQDSSNSWTRCMLHGGSSGFVSSQYSSSPGGFNGGTVNIPISANTWYFGQFALVGPNVCAITVWPVGQARPGTPSLMQWITNIPNAGLVFQANGDNGSNLITYSVSSVTMTSNASNGTVGYGVSMMSLSSDNSTWGCPSYSGGSSFANGPWCVYSNQSFPFTLSGTDGKKTIYYRYTDNVGRTLTGSGSIIYDTTPPVVNSLTPGNDSEVRGIVTVQVNATDPAAPDGSSSGVASAVLYVDGAQVGSPVSGTSKPTFLWDTTDLTPGVHTLTAKATDAAGNTGVIGGSTTVIVDNTSGTSSAIIGSANVANGDAIISHTDLDIPGRGPELTITRTYHSLSNEIGFFGHKWSSNLDEALSFPSDGSVVYTDASGGYHVFLPNGSGGYLTSPGLYMTLVKNSDGTYTITDRDQSKTNFSSIGQLGSIVDRHGNTLTINYGSNGFPSTVTDATGRQLIITSSNDGITQITDPAGNVYKYRYNAGYLEDYINPQGIETAYNLHSIPGMLTSFTVNYTSAFPVGDAQTNVTTKLTYDSENRLVKLVDPMGYDTDLTYSTVGDASQTVVQRLQGISPATYASATFLMTTDGMGSVAKMTDALGNSTTYQYNANGNATQVTDPNGHIVTSTYDTNGNILTQTIDPGRSPHLNLKTSYTYDSANNVLTKTDPAGIVTQYTYDSPTAGDVIKTIENYVSGGAANSDTNVTATATYDSCGEVLTTTDPTGVVTQNTYDQYGDVLTTIANYKSGVTPDFQTNVTTSATYDVLGERVTATNPLGIMTQYTYDNLGHVIQTVANYQSGQPSTVQVNVSTKTSYDALGRPVTTTSPRGLVTKAVYDDDGRVTQTILDYVNGGPSDTQTNVIASTRTYDAMGDVLTAADAKGNVTTTTYDLDGRALKTTQADSSGTVLSNGQVVYDAAGQVIERDTLDASGTVLLKLIYSYDSVGRSTTTTAPPAIPGVQGQAGNSNVSTVTYNANGEEVDVKTTNAGLPSPGVVEDTTATYDHLGRPLSKTEEAGTSSSQTTSYIYDLDGRQTSMTDPAGHVTSTTYGALGEALSTTQADGTVNIMTYDTAGEVLSRSNSAGTTKDTYGPLGRVTYEERDDGNGALQTGVTYTYDADGNKLTQQTNYGGGTNTTYTWTFDKLDRAATMSDGTRTYTYDLNSNVTQMAVAVGGNTITQDSYTYDGKNRLSGLTTTVTTSNTTLHNYGYAYDALGNQKQITADGTTTTYSYDNLNQLVDVKQGSTTVASYSYDANSNRISMTTSAGTTSYSYDSSNTMLTSKTDPNGKVTNYTYDKNGNLTQEDYDPSGSKQLTGFTYDAENRLTRVTEPGGMMIQFAYDADGNRISKTVTSGSTVTTIKYVYTLGHLSEEQDGSGNALASFTYEESGRPASVVLGNPSTGNRYYYVYNGHGDVVALTDAGGTVVASYAYDAFGAITSSSENFPNGWSNPYRYDGADGVLYDGETGLYWMSVRAYDPTLGRFLQHDPLGRLAAEGVDFHPYVYTGNNPINRTDPSGERYTCGNGCSTGTTNSNDCAAEGEGWDAQIKQCVPRSKPPTTPTPTKPVTVTTSPPTGTPSGNPCKGKPSCWGPPNDPGQTTQVSQTFGIKTNQFFAVGFFGLKDAFIPRLQTMQANLPSSGIGNFLSGVGGVIMGTSGFFTLGNVGDPAMIAGVAIFAVGALTALASLAMPTTTEGDVSQYFNNKIATLQDTEAQMEQDERYDPKAFANDMNWVFAFTDEKVTVTLTQRIWMRNGFEDVSTSSSYEKYTIQTYQIG